MNLIKYQDFTMVICYYSYCLLFTQTSCYLEKEQEAKLKLDVLKVQVQFIAEFGRQLLDLGVSLIQKKNPP
jgi:hypothetical protein